MKRICTVTIILITPPYGTNFVNPYLIGLQRLFEKYNLYKKLTL